VVVIDELDMSDENIPLLLLGNEGTIKKSIRYRARARPILRSNVQTYINLIYLFYHDEVKDMTEMNEILPADVRRNVRHAIEDLGLEEMINEIGIDKVIAAVGIDKVTDAIDTRTLERALARRKGKGK
jgi:hypothetical protein